MAQLPVTRSGPKLSALAGHYRLICMSEISADCYFQTNPRIDQRRFRTSRLLEVLSIALGGEGFTKLIGQLAKTDLLVLDDWNLEKMTCNQRNDLPEIM